MGKKRLNKNQTEEQPGLLRGRGVRPTKWRERVRANPLLSPPPACALIALRCSPDLGRSEQGKRGRAARYIPQPINLEFSYLKDMTTFAIVVPYDRNN